MQSTNGLSIKSRQPSHKQTPGKNTSTVDKQDKATREVRLRLLKMIQENERIRRGENADQLVQR